MVEPLPDSLSTESSFNVSHLDWIREDPLELLRGLRLEMAAKGQAIFDLSMLNPDLPPPRFLLDRLLEASFKPQNHRYAVSRGVRKLREAFAVKYARAFGVRLDPESEVCATMGTKEALQHLLMVASPPGGRILLGRPAYPAYVSAARLAGLDCTFFEINPDEEVMLESIEACLRRQPVRVLLLNFPNNPTGQLVSSRFYDQLAPLCQGRVGLVINDFVYGEMAYQEPGAVSVLRTSAMRGRAVEIYSLSKAYNVPGWRVAGVLGWPEAVRELARLKAHVDYGIFLPVQYAAATALSSDSNPVAATVIEYRDRARLMASALQRGGWGVHTPEAGASIWARIPAGVAQRIICEAKRGLSSQLCQRLLLEEGILLMPGVMFGAEYDPFVRVALVCPNEVLREAASRMESFCNRILGRREAKPDP